MHVSLSAFRLKVGRAPGAEGKHGFSTEPLRPARCSRAYSPPRRDVCAPRSADPLLDTELLQRGRVGYLALVIEQVQQLGVVRAVEAAELGARLLGHRALDVDRVDVVWVARGRAQRATACA